MTEQRGRPIKQAAYWMLFLGPFFFLVYGLCNWVTSQRLDVSVYVFDWERHIPFMPWLIWPYMSIDLFFAASVFVCQTRTELNQHAYRIITAIVISALGFLLFPLRFSFSVPPVEGITGWLFQSLHAFDQPYNQAPSLHISLLMILWVKYAKHLTGLWRRLLDAWFLLIFVSVVGVYQHHMIDVITGFIVGLICLYWFPEQPWRWLKTKPDDYLALRYGISGLVLLTISCILQGAAWILAWPALSLLIVSVAYAGLGSGVFQKDANGKQSWPARCLLYPYQLAIFFSAKQHLRHLDPYTMITPNIGIGGMRAPKVARWDAVLDMTSEFQADKQSNYLSLPVLDLTVPHREVVGQAIQWLSQQPTDAKICIHCALGLSRSATILAAWLVHTGQAKNAAEAFMHIRLYRPVVWKIEHERLIDSVCGV